MSSPKAARPGRKLRPPVHAASGIRAPPPRVKPNPVTVRSSRPGTGREQVSVIAAKPPAASTARPALARTALSPNPAGRPTSNPRPANARPAAAGARRPAFRPVARSAASTMTGAAPMVTKVASGTEVSDTAVK
jgi:hypothetical protein